MEDESELRPVPTSYTRDLVFEFDREFYDPSDEDDIEELQSEIRRWAIRWTGVLEDEGESIHEDKMTRIIETSGRVMLDHPEIACDGFTSEDDGLTEEHWGHLEIEELRELDQHLISLGY